MGIGCEGSVKSRGAFCVDGGAVGKGSVRRVVLTDGCEKGFRPEAQESKSVPLGNSPVFPIMSNHRVRTSLLLHTYPSLILLCLVTWVQLLKSNHHRRVLLKGHWFHWRQWLEGLNMPA